MASHFEFKDVQALSAKVMHIALSGSKSAKLTVHMAALESSVRKSSTKEFEAAIKGIKDVMRSFPGKGNKPVNEFNTTIAGLESAVKNGLGRGNPFGQITVESEVPDGGQETEKGARKDGIRKGFAGKTEQEANEMVDKINSLLQMLSSQIEDNDFDERVFKDDESSQDDIKDTRIQVADICAKLKAKRKEDKRQRDDCQRALDELEKVAHIKTKSKNKVPSYDAIRIRKCTEAMKREYDKLKELQSSDSA